MANHLSTICVHHFIFPAFFTCQCAWKGPFKCHLYMCSTVKSILSDQVLHPGFHYFGPIGPLCKNVGQQENNGPMPVVFCWLANVISCRVVLGSNLTARILSETAVWFSVGQWISMFFTQSIFSLSMFNITQKHWFPCFWSNPNRRYAKNWIIIDVKKNRGCITDCMWFPILLH